MLEVSLKADNRVQKWLTENDWIEYPVSAPDTCNQFWEKVVQLPIDKGHTKTIHFHLRYYSFDYEWLDGSQMQSEYSLSITIEIRDKFIYEFKTLSIPEVKLKQSLDDCCATLIKAFQALES